MDYISNIECGCKGIRTCLICEKDKGLTKSDENKKTVKYSYCHHCNLCWPKDVPHEEKVVPLYLGELTLISDFLTMEEEAEAISAIDQIPWMLSQSGRKKQDFGPKVNFKKKKGKVGDFKGFPSFTKKLIKRFEYYKELSDFQPVELCHLDYSPDRGSAIEPHIDDSWMWGERLVTINLASSTILTLSPANLETCNCSTQLEKNLKSVKCEINKNSDCSHKIFTKSSSSLVPFKWNNSLHSKLVEDMCSVFRTAVNDSKVEINVFLPPRSLLVLAGCGRHNWFHAIKRKDISSRRVAMTFRELSKNFSEGGADEELGDKLLEIGNRFFEIEL